MKANGEFPLASHLLFLGWSSTLKYEFLPSLALEKVLTFCFEGRRE
jgi:hypothetical protein